VLLLVASLGIGGCGGDDGSSEPVAEQAPVQPDPQDERKQQAEQAVVGSATELVRSLGVQYRANSADCIYEYRTPGGMDVFDCTVSGEEVVLGPLDWLVEQPGGSAYPYDSHELADEVATKIGVPATGGRLLEPELVEADGGAGREGEVVAEMARPARRSAARASSTRNAGQPSSPWSPARFT
jgi:hypothetical protein